ncbi:hypothetical protein BJP50_16245 [Paenibacillus odorifer]|nr:hypothetical protein BJP50_16245 [Paenibacillus odorifer]
MVDYVGIHFLLFKKSIDFKGSGAKLVPQLYLNGACSDAIELYKKTFRTETDSIMYDTQKDPEKFVIHAEMHILGTRLMLSDFGGTNESQDTFFVLT